MNIDKELLFNYAKKNISQFNLISYLLESKGYGIVAYSDQHIINIHTPYCILCLWLGDKSNKRFKNTKNLLAKLNGDLLVDVEFLFIATDYFEFNNEIRIGVEKTVNTIADY